MSSLSFIVLVCLSVCATVCWGKHDIKDGRHNITMSQRRLHPNPPEVQLVYDYQRDSSRTLRVQSKDICYTPKDTYGRRAVITAFHVTDLLPSGKGGYAFVDSGGLNFGHLCLHLKTQRGGSYSFLVEIWGYYIN